MHRPIGGVEGKDPSLRGKVEDQSLRGRIAASLKESIASQEPSTKKFFNTETY